ncbi:hypothetical protein TELCIR_07740 [Teladorsagia circumcincta]|uniref:Reverse transcriptase domain-containing protein n=1 Tax=Teladorsagia circumcincta TaxID=45464 RepID=A0A2G9UJT0_TELCI|nr:hypothetical protein TELCIR_07740 [Teladorsagia circumcincta]
METILGGIDGVLVYLDDITVTGPDDKTHLGRLETVLRRLKEAGFKLKRQKCEFFKKEIEFLGHVVDANGTRPSPNKLKAILNMPQPKNLKELESYLGMVQYYGKFVPRLATLAAPLNELRKKGVEWQWKEKQAQAFQAIRKRLTTVDTLAHYNPEVPVVLATDASEYGRRPETLRHFSLAVAGGGGFSTTTAGVRADGTGGHRSRGQATPEGAMRTDGNGEDGREEVEDG